MNIENIKDMMDGMDLGALFPPIHSILDLVPVLVRLSLLAGPFVLLGLGLYYFLGAPKEANYRSGYRCHWGMGSVEAWAFTQKLAGSVFSLVGLALVIAMAILAASLAQRSLMDQLLQSLVYLAVQAGVILVLRLGVNLTVALRYDAKGNRRYSWAELFRG